MFTGISGFGLRLFLKNKLKKLKQKQTLQTFMDSLPTH